MIINKIAFIFPPASVNSVGVENSFIPNGLITLANQVNDWNNKIDIKILDGSILGKSGVLLALSEFEPQVVGLSALCGNYEVGKQILQECHRKGMITIVGNHHANYLWSIIPLMKVDLMPEVDYIITGNSDGDTLIPLIEGIESNSCNFENLDNICFRKDNRWIRPSKIKYKAETLSFPDLKYIDSFEPYFKNYRRVFENYHNDISQVKAINVNFFKGCIQGSSAPCIYCCLKDHKMKSLEPVVFWEQIQSLHDQYGFNCFWETANSLTSLSLMKFTHGRNYLEELVDTMPEDLKQTIKFMIYARADEITPQNISLLKKLNVYRVVIGLDSGDSSILNKEIHKKNITEGMNIQVAKMLKENDIQLYACYVPGSIGETAESLEKTKQEIYKIIDLGNCCTIEFTSLAPMPGSQAWEIIKESYFEEYGVHDVIKVGDLAKFWVKLKVKDISWENIENVKNVIKIKAESSNVIFGGYY